MPIKFLLLGLFLIIADNLSGQPEPDTIPPTPLCKFGLSHTYQNSSDTLHINSFNDGSFDPEHENTNLRFSFSSNPEDTLRIFSCLNGEIGLVPVQMWVTDEAGNQAFCETFLNLVLPSNPDSLGLGNCVTGTPLSGRISTTSSNPIEGAIVNISGDLNFTVVTGNSGQYNFPTSLKNFTIVPSKIDSTLNGISTLDMLVIIKHILGVELLDSPYKIIAADVDGSGTINLTDVLAIRSRLLGATNSFPAGDYIFVPTNYEFENVGNPLQEDYPSIIKSIALEETGYMLDFIGIRLGDINDSTTFDKSEEKLRLYDR